MVFCPERLSGLRIKKGLTRAEAARLLNMSAMGYGRYEKGERTPSYQTVAYIARIFNTSTGYLYGLSDEAEAASITISSSDDPALFELIADVLDKKNPARDRILAYYKQLKGLKDQ